MLNWLTKRLRLQAALIVIAVYALSVVAPPVALAFIDGSVAAHCLFEDSDGAPHLHAKSASIQVAPHQHITTAAHNHADISGPLKAGDETQAAVVGCCGLFSAPAVFRSQTVLLVDRVPESLPFPTLDYNLTGRGPELLHRPPIAL